MYLAEDSDLTFVSLVIDISARLGSQEADDVGTLRIRYRMDKLKHDPVERRSVGETNDSHCCNNCRERCCCQRSKVCWIGPCASILPAGKIALVEESTNQNHRQSPLICMHLNLTPQSTSRKRICLHFWSRPNKRALASPSHSSGLTICPELL